MDSIFPAVQVRGDRLDDRPRVLESVAHLVGLDMECLVLALVSQIAQGVELVEVRADIEVVESGKRILAR